LQGAAQAEQQRVTGPVRHRAAAGRGARSAARRRPDDHQQRHPPGRRPVPAAQGSEDRAEGHRHHRRHHASRPAPGDRRRHVPRPGHRPQFHRWRVSRAMSSSAHATLPRLASLVRLLLQLRMLLAAFALLLIPGERLTPPTFLLILSFALLSGLAARYWERFVPYLREHPLLITLDVCLTSSVLVIEGPSGPVFIITVITAAVCGILYGVRGAVLVVLLQILCYTVAVVLYAFTHGQEAPVEVMSFQALLVHPALYPIAAYTGSKVRAVLAELAEEQEARKQAELAAAAAEERDRLARDMHDSVAKTLRGAAMAAQALPLWLQKDPERAAGIAAQVADAADTASTEARALIADLRDQDAGAPFTELVERAVQDWAEQKIGRATCRERVKI